jgi:hypothetical protein
MACSGISHPGGNNGGGGNGGGGNGGTGGSNLACNVMSAGQGASLNGFVPFTGSSLWNTDISSAPVDPNSNSIISNWVGSVNLHPDWGTDPTYGIPYVVVNGSQPLVNVNLGAYPSESDPGPMPVPADAPVEGGSSSTGDRHVLVLDNGNCFLYELYNSLVNPNGTWNADSTAVWDLLGNEQRPYTWTSADAAGLPVFPGLVRYDEVAAGKIQHAFRFTLPKTSAAFTPPASHWAATSSDPTSPPMGMRLRLKSSYDISSFDTQMQVILTAMKTYGLILADNGSDMYIQGTYDTRWDNDVLNPAFDSLQAGDFEVVQLGWKGPPPQQPCVAGGTRLCLQGGRFAVDVTYVLADAAGSGAGTTLPLTVDTGAYWFFSQANIEMLVKVLNGCATGNHFWIFAAGLTNVQVVLTVTDTQTGAARRYVNPQGTPFAPIQDTAALPCP